MSGFRDVIVVNMVPESMSGTVNVSGSPDIAVNPENPMEMAAIAYFPPPTDSTVPSIGLLYSNDGGSTWSPLPHEFSAAPITASLCFATKGGQLYVAYGHGNAPPSGSPNLVDVVRATNSAGGLAPAALLSQTSEWGSFPGVRAITIPSLAAGTDRVYETSSARVTIVDNAAVAPQVKTIALPLRAKSKPGDPGPGRSVVHPDGTVYVAYYGTSIVESKPEWQYLADLVVARDDTWGLGSKPFQALVDPDDKRPGVRVVSGIGYQQAYPPENEFLHFYMARALALAVHPDNSSVVYVCWADVSGTTWRVHIRKSTDRGNTWSKTNLRSVNDATDGAIAFASDGRLGFFYRALKDSDAGGQTIQAVFEVTDNDFQTKATHVLADTPLSSAAVGDQIFNLTETVFLSDNLSTLSAVDTTFYGSFQAVNTPDHENFPSGVTYQRLCDFTKKVLLNEKGDVVKTGHDPFFFSYRLGRAIRKFHDPNPELKGKPETKSEIVDIKITKLEHGEKGQLPDEVGRDGGWQEAIRQGAEATKAIAARVDALAKEVATLRAFIEVHERPAAATPDEPEAKAPEARTVGSTDDEA